MRRARHAALAAILVWLVTLLAAPGAAAAPSVTYKCTPAPQNCTGWYQSNVSIEWTVLPRDATKTGCVNQTFTTDTTAHERVLPRRRRLSRPRSVEVEIRVDKTPPVVTGGQPARAADTNGWYNHAVAVKFQGNDLTSGLDPSSCTATTYGGPDDAAAKVIGSCTDKAGNESESFRYGLKYDATAPTVTAARTDRHRTTAPGSPLLCGSPSMRPTRPPASRNARLSPTAALTPRLCPLSAPVATSPATPPAARSR